VFFSIVRFTDFLSLIRRPRDEEAVSKLSLPAPTARNVKAWGNAPGKEKLNFEALKARHFA
jgi:hypothetical protein